MACSSEPGSSGIASKDVTFSALYSCTLVPTSVLFNFLLCIEVCTNCDSFSITCSDKLSSTQHKILEQNLAVSLFIIFLISLACTIPKQ